jgi:uroporphyrinogen III methyltransferase/synthase
VTVYLVGAGPGDPGLLTVRGSEVLRRAEVVVHDRLADPVLLELAPGHAERFDVGKNPGGPVDQSSINDLLVAHGRAGRVVVRLKGGDPFVFGRGGEEALALAEAGVPFEVIPGVSSAVAVPAYAGVPVTHRGLSTSFTVVTGHSRAAIDADTDWEVLARAGGTIVVLMGVAHRGEIAARLIAGGLPRDTPVAAVRWGTRPEQRSARTTLGQLGALSLQPPATMVIGAVAGLDLRWYEQLPLFGRRVVVTRAREQASGLSATLRELGARPIEVPVIRFEPPADGGVGLERAAGELRAGRYDWVAFTSANAVGPLLARLHDARDFHAARLAAIGPGTAEALAAHGLVADLLPERYVAEGLLEVFPSAAEERRRVLLPRAGEARETLPEGLAALGWRVDVVEAYRTVAAAPSEAVLAAAANADAVCFTASSTVTRFVEIAGRGAVPPVVACIGPITAATARQAGIEVATVATEHTIPGLVAALAEALGGPAS